MSRPNVDALETLCREWAESREMAPDVPGVPMWEFLASRGVVALDALTVQDIAQLYYQHITQPAESALRGGTFNVAEWEAALEATAARDLAGVTPAYVERVRALWAEKFPGVRLPPRED